MIKVRNQGSVAVVLICLITLLTPSTVGASAWSYRQDKLAPLLTSSLEVIQGVRNSQGCQFPAERDGRVVPPGSVWEVRDVAIDLEGCRKLRESGIPTSLVTPSLENSVAEPIPLSRPESIVLSASGSRSITHLVWWTDLVGLPLTSDRTDISWSWSAGCVTSGSGQANFGWNTATGWYLLEHASSGSRTCSRYFGTSNSHFRNTAFCGQQVDTWYFYVQDYGFSDGSASTYRSSDTYTECLPVFLNYQVHG